MYKNIDKQTKLNLKDLVEYQEPATWHTMSATSEWVSLPAG